MPPVAGMACRLNSHRDTGVITPAPKDGCRIHRQGRTCWMSGQHSFSRQPVGGTTLIEVSAP